MGKRTNISADIIEKDYYVCAVLKELSKKQDYLKAYFKGGTAVYKYKSLFDVEDMPLHRAGKIQV